MVSKRDYDDALSAEQVAAADLKSADAKVTEAKLNLGYTRVVAPVSGVAGGAAKSEGSLVSGPDVLLTTIVQTNPVKAVFGIPDAEHARIQADIRAGRLQLPPDGFGVEVAAADGTLLARGGKLQFSEPLVNSATGTVRSQAELPNADYAIKPGQFVRVRLVGATRPDVVQVPQRAVLEGPQGKFVYVAARQRQARDEGRDRGDAAAGPGGRMGRLARRQGLGDPRRTAFRRQGDRRWPDAHRARRARADRAGAGCSGERLPARPASQMSKESAPCSPASSSTARSSRRCCPSSS